MSVFAIIGLLFILFDFANNACKFACVNFNYKQYMPVHFYLFSRPNKAGEYPINVSVSLGGVRLFTSIGYSVYSEHWDSSREIMKRGTMNSKRISYSLINSRINQIRSDFEKAEGVGAKLTKQEMKEMLASITGKAPLQRYNDSIFADFDKFVSEGVSFKFWAENTTKKFGTLRRHLYKYNPELRYSDMDEEWFNQYVNYCTVDLALLNTSVTKELSLIRWFLRWATDKGLNSNMTFTKFRARLKETKRPIIYFNEVDLMRLYTYKIPANGTEVILTDINGNTYTKVVSDKAPMDKARDLFCFCCFTSLRYSDMAKLKRTDISDGVMRITTQKTDDFLEIELNEYALQILSKYEAFDFDGYALPPLSNQKLNVYIKQLCELCGFNSPIVVTQYCGGKREDLTYPKWQLVHSHSGRATFICIALSAGIPVDVVMKFTGHSDYDAMRPYIDISSSAKAEAMKIFENKLKK